MTCFFKRVVPFVLALGLGLSLAGYNSSIRPRAERPSTESRQDRAVSIERAPDVVIPDRVLARHFPRSFMATLRLGALLGADGRVSAVRPVPMLPYGDTEASLDTAGAARVSPLVLNGSFVADPPAVLVEPAVEAARRIEFTPAVRGGERVPTRVIINYNFVYFGNDPHCAPNCFTSAEATILEDGVVRLKPQVRFID